MQDDYYEIFVAGVNEHSLSVQQVRNVLKVRSSLKIIAGILLLFLIFSSSSGNINFIKVLRGDTRLIRASSSSSGKINVGKRLTIVWSTNFTVNRLTDS